MFGLFSKPIPFVKSEKDIRWSETEDQIKRGLHIEKTVITSIVNDRYVKNIEEVVIWPDKKERLEVCYTRSGGFYLGSEKIAKYITERLGLYWIISTQKSKAANVGCGSDGSSLIWYGWSHRGMCSFRPGDKIFVPGISKNFRESGFTTIQTLEQGKEAAINFANYIA